MKSLILPSLCLLSSFSVAQTIPNSGFETWIDSTEFFPTEYEYPQYWSLESCVEIEEGDWSCDFYGQKSTDAHTGMYALKVQNKELSSGLVVTAAGENWGIPFTGSASTFSFYAKTLLYNNDKAVVSAYLVGDELIGDALQVYSSATVEITNNASNYTFFKSEFELWDEDVLSKRIFIVVSVDNDDESPDSRSYIIIDDLGIGTATNLAADLKSKAPVFYPNPVSDELYLSRPMEYSVQDLMGKSYLSGNAGSISVASLPKGVYILRTTDGNGAARLQKFVKQ